MRRLQLYQLEREVAQSGSVRWQSLAPIWVLMRPVRGRPQLRRGDPQIIISHRAQMRRHQDLEVGMRLMRSGRSFLIHHAEPMGRREGWVSCLCEEQVAALGFGASS